MGAQQMYEELSRRLRDASVPNGLAGLDTFPGLAEAEAGGDAPDIVAVDIGLLEAMLGTVHDAILNGNVRHRCF